MDDKEQFLVEFEDVVNIGEAGTSDFNELANRPSYNGQPMTGATNIPEVPVVNDAKLTINQNGVEKGSFTANDSDDTTIDLDNTTYNDFIGTDGVEAGEAGLVPAPSTTDANKFLKADGTWDEPEETTEIQYIELTPTGVVAQGITVTASKYLDEVIDLAEAGIKVVFKVTLPSGTGFPTEGTYELPLFNWDATSNKAIAMTVVDLSGTVYSINFGYDPGSHVNTGGIAIAIVPTGGGGGGTTYTAGDGIVIDDGEIAVDLVQTTGNSTKKVMSQDAVTQALAGAGGGSAPIRFLTEDDYNYTYIGSSYVAVWLLQDGVYVINPYLNTMLTTSGTFGYTSITPYSSLICVSTQKNSSYRLVCVLGNGSGGYNSKLQVAYTVKLNTDGGIVGTDYNGATS